MPGSTNPYHRRRRRKSAAALLPFLIAALIMGSVAMIYLSIHIATVPSTPVLQGGSSSGVQPEKNQPPQQTQASQQTQEPTEEKQTQPTAEPEHVVSTATISATGDLLMHSTIFMNNAAVNPECYRGEDGYNFDSIFKYVKEYTSAFDYAIANLETTLYGSQKPYSGNPKFNTPDEIVDGAKGAGFDMLLTANNHCNDTGLQGILRTLEVVREKGLATLGTNLTNEEDKYQIVDVNGIQIGMLCYTYEDSRDPRLETFNYNPLDAAGKGLVCAFPKFPDKSRDPFYEGLEAQMKQMKEKGAEAIVLFLHWGEEYHLGPSSDQKKMAQKLCDLGVDVIVGGHPHVIQPIELLTSSTDPAHKTVCLYSMGNAVSNQRRDKISSCPTGHTEDGMLFNLTFEKYSDGTVYLAGVDVIPTWVDMHKNEAGKREYNILPLDNARRDQWQSMFSLSEETLQSAAASYDRTMELVGSGLETSNSYLEERKQQRDAAYLAAAA